jgi:hypothetical protein
MGFFGSFVFDGRSWTPQEPGTAPTSDIVGPWLHVDIHDSDIATVTYRPTGPGSGVAYLGYSPRTYFDDPDASAPTDVAREAAGLAAWWADQRGGATDVERNAKAATLIGYLAEDQDPTDIDLDEEDDDLDDADILVEGKAAQLLIALDLPVPDDLLP